MELTVKERVHAKAYLPLRGSIEEKKTKFDLIEKLKFTEEETATLDYIEENGRAQWQKDKEFISDIDLSDAEKQLIIKGLEELSQAGVMDDETYEMYLKFKEGN